MRITFSPGTPTIGKLIREAILEHFGKRASLARFGKGTIEVQMKKN